MERFKGDLGAAMQTGHVNLWGQSNTKGDVQGEPSK